MRVLNNLETRQPSNSYHDFNKVKFNGETQIYNNLPMKN